MTYRFELRAGNATEWMTKNPVLLLGEPGVEADTGRFKIGNGTNHWNDLPYATDWNSVTDKPDTYPPTIGNTGTTAMRGDAIVVNPESIDGLPDGTLIART